MIETRSDSEKSVQVMFEQENANLLSMWEFYPAVQTQLYAHRLSVMCEVQSSPKALTLFSFAPVNIREDPVFCWQNKAIFLSETYLAKLLVKQQ